MSMGWKVILGAAPGCHPDDAASGLENEATAGRLQEERLVPGWRLGSKHLSGRGLVVWAPPGRRPEPKLTSWETRNVRMHQVCTRSS